MVRGLVALTFVVCNLVSVLQSVAPPPPAPAKGEKKAAGGPAAGVNVSPSRTLATPSHASPHTNPLSSPATCAVSIRYPPPQVQGGATQAS